MDQDEMDDEAVQMWFNGINNPNLSSVTAPPPFTLFGSQNDDVESRLCSELSRIMILNDNDNDHYHQWINAGIGTSREGQQQQQQQNQNLEQGFVNINTPSSPSPYPAWLHFHNNNLVTEPIGPPRHIQKHQGSNNIAKRTFLKEQTFGESQVDSSTNHINVGNSGWGGYQPIQLQKQSFDSSTNSYYMFSPIPQRRQIIRKSPPLSFECDKNSYIILKNETKGRCRSIWAARRQNSFQEEVPIRVHGESSKNSSGIDFKPKQCMVIPSYEDLVRLQGSSMFVMAKDQNGCRLLQNSFHGENIQNMEVVFNGIIDYVVPLMVDPFGNYLVQKLLDFCFDYQRLKIVLMITKQPGQLVTISLNSYGTRVVQKLIKTLKTDMEIQLVRSAILPGFLQLIEDPNGNHVIQSCLLYLGVQDNEFIFDAATKYCVKIATHQHGCCVLQRCIEYSKRRSQDKLVKEICKNGLQLAKDEYGNYVVQYVMKMENLNSSAKFTLTSQFEGNYVDLSMQKFSSHVVETCLDYIPESRDTIVHELLSVAEFEHLMQHPFANYVIQSALSVTKGHLHRSLAEVVRQHKKLHTSPYCKKIFSKNLLKR